ncbi:MAG: hypothetical protein IJU76_08175 [Desulfovibrionaceae bacterium]|nr:hypothetical protein [Desulfovibrionaceae bacterium]
MDKAPAMAAADRCIQEALDFLREHARNDDAVACVRLELRKAQNQLARARRLHEKRQGQPPEPGLLTLLGIKL